MFETIVSPFLFDCCYLTSFRVSHTPHVTSWRKTDTWSFDHSLSVCEMGTHVQPVRSDAPDGPGLIRCLAAGGILLLSFDIPRYGEYPHPQCSNRNWQLFPAVSFSSTYSAVISLCNKRLFSPSSFCVRMSRCSASSPYIQFQDKITEDKDGRNRSESLLYKDPDRFPKQPCTASP